MVDIDGLVDQARAAIAAARSTEEIREVAASVTGKKSGLARVGRELGSLDPGARKELGSRLHAARTTVERLLEDRRAEIATAERAREMAESRIDLTEFIPGSRPVPAARGHVNLVTRTQSALEDVFVGMGFEVAEGPEIESDWYNFGALNIPPAHPAQGHVGHLLPRSGRPGVDHAADPHLAGPDPSDGAGRGRGATAHPRRDARPLLPA